MERGRHGGSGLVVADVTPTIPDEEDARPSYPPFERCPELFSVRAHPVPEPAGRLVHTSYLRRCARPRHGASSGPPSTTRERAWGSDEQGGRYWPAPRPPPSLRPVPVPRRRPARRCWSAGTWPGSPAT